MKSFTPIFQNDILIDIETTINDRPVRMLGKAGAAREEAILAPLKNHESQGNADGVLPVLLGAGLGHALKALLATTKGPIAVVDKESELFTLSNLREKYPDPRIFWVIVPEGTPSKAIYKTLALWQMEHKNKPFILLANSFYQRLDPWYQEIRHNINMPPSQPSVWENARKPRFITKTPRILFITSKYYLLGELAKTCEQCGYEYDLIELWEDFMDQETFMLTLLQKVTAYKPDCIITMNHLAIDTNGILLDMLERMQVPIASWFVDNPHLVLDKFEGAKNPWLTLFTWDTDNIPTLQADGYKHVFYLPLGTNQTLFYPRPKHERLYDAVCRDITFVGNAMVSQVAWSLSQGTYSRTLLQQYKEVAKTFSVSQERSVYNFLKLYYPELAKACDALDITDRLYYETVIISEATRQYRRACIEAILPFNPLIIGDSDWHSTLRNTQKTWEYKPSVTYHTELPRVYPYSTINFNCTSRQMKGSVNQRIFDVPAAGGFILTDWQEQMDTLLERDKEIIVYHEVEEIPEIVRFYLKNDTTRKAIITAGRKRVLGEHTWAHRLQTMVKKIKDIYGS